MKRGALIEIRPFRIEHYPVKNERLKRNIKQGINLEKKICIENLKRAMIHKARDIGIKLLKF